MSIYGIGTTSHQTSWYGSEKTAGKAAEGNFAKRAAQAAQTAGRATATLHGADESSGDTAIFMSADLVNGSSVSVYKTPDFDRENPVYKVKIWDGAGHVTERMVDVSKVDPKNCDTAEIYAFAAGLKESGKGSFEDTVLKAAVAKVVKNAEQKSAGGWSFSDKTDWVKTVKDIMQSEYSYGDLRGYMEWKKFLGFLEEDGLEGQDRSNAVAGRDASRVLDSLAQHAPEEVRQAFLEAEKETGGIITVFGLWISNDGKQSYMTQMGIERFVRWYNGDFNESDLLGTTVGSAINAVKKWIYEVDHPLSGQPSGAEEKRLMAMERAFYVSFLEKLKKLSDR